MIDLQKDEYKALVKKYKPKEPRVKNAVISFLVGGFLGFFSEVISDILVVNLGLSKMVSYSVICILMILISSFLTALGVFDNLIEKGKCGLIIPTTGFAHSVTSSSLEYKKDGLITGVGANFFKLAGSVILYGIVSSFFLCILRVIISG